MQIHRHDESSTTTPPEPGFTGAVELSGYFRSTAPSRLTGAVVTFAPGARTPWKVNPLGQTLVVTAGAGRVAVEGQPVAEIRAGDLVRCPPGRKHWDGATAHEAMTCVVLQEGGTTFLERVSDEDYEQRPAAGPAA